MKNKKYLKWVAEQPCIYCGKESQAHHLRVYSLGAGAGKKAPDYFTLPVCYEHHAECHSLEIEKSTSMSGRMQTIGRAFEYGIIEWKEK